MINSCTMCKLKADLNPGSINGHDIDLSKILEIFTACVRVIEEYRVYFATILHSLLFVARCHKKDSSLLTPPTPGIQLLS